jgi:hypothetical protein
MGEVEQVLIGRTRNHFDNPDNTSEQLGVGVSGQPRTNGSAA